jgi:putative methyltransferase
MIDLSSSGGFSSMKRDETHLRPIHGSGGLLRVPAKRRVYFNEFNVLLENAAYLPFVSGLLRAYAETSEIIKAHYEFMPFLFYRDRVERIVSEYDDPSVAAFSVSMWNEQLNLRVAEIVKRLYPDCRIVFGGPNVPHHPQQYFEQYPFVDVAVRAEGEEAFADILLRSLDSWDYSGIPGIAWRDPVTGICVRNEMERPQSRDLDVYPSPYVNGLFEELMVARPDLEFQQIIETNRGCPFPCTFCFWGQGGLSRKYRFHGLSHVNQEIEWAAKHKIRYLFNADSNFGMHIRDYEIAQFLVDYKSRYGYPDKFRTCFGKNTDDKIYQVAKLLHDHELEKGITLARQSNNDEVLENIKRTNIKMSTYRNLQIRFNETNIPVYCELILGLPGETYQTWTSGIEDLLRSGLKNQLFVYMCGVYPNTELAEPEYLKKFGIVTHRIPLTEIHGAIRPEGLVTEYEDIVIATKTMPVTEWRRMAVFSWVTMLLHSMKLGFFIMYYLQDRHGIDYTELISYISDRRMRPGSGTILRGEVAEFESQLDRILAGHGRGRELPEFGAIYWDEEEASFLRIAGQLDRFYDELLTLLRELLDEKGIPWDEAELREAVQYQRMRIPSCGTPTITEWRFGFKFPEYFDNCFRSDVLPLIPKAQRMALVGGKDNNGDMPKYARNTILWGRKSGTMLTDIVWQDE